MKQSNEEISKFLSEKFPEKQGNKTKIAKYMNVLKKHDPKEYKEEKERQNIDELRYVVGTRYQDVPKIHQKVGKSQEVHF